ncbi:MAG: hypothetical protein IKT77_06530 [Paludibacteraceae bacterium]|nr:hypothetical protein [Paludibacteraceae bacterium]
MNNLKFYIYLLVCVFIFASCENKQTPIKKLEKLDKTLVQQSESFTEQDWENALMEYEQIEQELSMYNYTDDELRQIGKMKGRLLAKISKEYLNKTMDEVDSYLKMFEGALEGFMEELGTALDSEEDYDE